MRRIQNDYSCDYPVFYYVDPGIICNLRCKFCSTGIGTGKIGTGIMELNTFKLILNKISKYAKEVHLYNYGEPFLNKNLIDFISLTSEKGIRTVVDSNLNARMFDEAEAKAIVKSGLSELSASIDGATQDTYEKYRVGGSMEKAIANIKQILEARKQLKSKTPFIVWSFLINKINEHQISLARQKAKKLGIAFSCNLMDVWGDKEWESSYHLDKGKYAILCGRIILERVFFGPGRKEKILRVLKLCKNSVENKMDRHQFPMNADTIKLSSRLPFWCSQPFDKMVVNWNGDVLICSAVSDEKATTGNLIYDDLNAVWNNEKMRKCRIHLLNADAKLDLGSLCGYCDVYQAKAKLLK